MPFTEEQVKKYLDGGAVTCPVCDSHDIEAERMDADGDEACQRVVCSRCGQAWFDMYKLVSVEPDERG